MISGMILGSALVAQYGGLVVTTPPTTYTTQRYVPQPPLVQTRLVEVQETVPQPPRLVTEEVTVPGETYVQVPATTVVVAPAVVGYGYPGTLVVPSGGFYGGYYGGFYGGRPRLGRAQGYQYRERMRYR